MHVEVRHSLTAIGTIVDDKTESGIREAFGLGDLPGGEKQMPEEFRVRRTGFRHARDQPLGDHEDMDRCLGRNIAEREAAIVLENDVCGDFTCNDLFEKRHES